MATSFNNGTVGISGGVAVAGFSIPAATQTVIFAKASTNHAAAGTPVLVRTNTAGKTFYLQKIRFWQTNSGTIPQYFKLYDDVTQVFEQVHSVERTATNNAFAFSYVECEFTNPIPFATSVKVDNTLPMGTVYSVAIYGFEQ